MSNPLILSAFSTNTTAAATNISQPYLFPIAMPPSLPCPLCRTSGTSFYPPTAQAEPVRSRNLNLIISSPSSCIVINTSHYQTHSSPPIPPQINLPFYLFFPLLLIPFNRLFHSVVDPSCFSSCSSSPYFLTNTSNSSLQPTPRFLQQLLVPAYYPQVPTFFARLTPSSLPSPLPVFSTLVHHALPTPATVSLAPSSFLPTFSWLISCIFSYPLATTPLLHV